MRSRFDYIQYDSMAASLQGSFKSDFIAVEKNIEDHLPNGRAKALALTALEECYMWIGKAIRDAQIARDDSAPLQESRSKV